MAYYYVMRKLNHFIIPLIVINIISCTSEKVTLMSYNIRYDNIYDEENSWSKRKDKVVSIFQKYSPSFIGTQEALNHQIKYINDLLKNYDYIGVGRDDGKSKGEFCAIYYDSSEFHLIKQATFWLSNDPLEVSVGWDAALERICTYGYFEHKNTEQRIWIFNTHFDHTGRISREKSSKLILDKINKLNGFSEPTVVMGDFNDLPNSPSIQTLNKKLDDAMLINKSNHIGPFGTYNGFNSKDPIQKRIDYIFVKRIEIFSHQHLDMRLINGNHISDHLAVIIEAKIGK